MLEEIGRFLGNLDLTINRMVYGLIAFGLIMLCIVMPLRLYRAWRKQRAIIDSRASELLQFMGLDMITRIFVNTNDGFGWTMAGWTRFGEPCNFSSNSDIKMLALADICDVFANVRIPTVLKAAIKKVHLQKQLNIQLTETSRGCYLLEKA